MYSCVDSMESKTQDDIIRSEKVEEREKEGSEQADTNREFLIEPNMDVCRKKSRLWQF